MNFRTPFIFNHDPPDESQKTAFVIFGSLSVQSPKQAPQLRVHAPRKIAKIAENDDFPAKSPKSRFPRRFSTVFQTSDHFIARARKSQFCHKDGELLPVFLACDRKESLFMFSLLRLMALLSFFLLYVASGEASLVLYSQNIKTDFDTVTKALAPYGKWVKQADGTTWVFYPNDPHFAPYTSGRWLYTDFGWYWQGTAPFSWAVEHYGFWKRDENKLWAWYPGSTWLPQIVELRASGDYIGWRCAEVDKDGNFIETATERAAKPEEWAFVTHAQFAGPITPQIMASPEQVKKLLDDSTDSSHTYFTYRDIERPGPHPANYLHLGDQQMFPPVTLADRLAMKAEADQSAQAALGQQAPTKPTSPENGQPKFVTGLPDKASTNSAQETAPAPSVNSGDPTPTPDTPDEANTVVDPISGKKISRKVKYWILMSLPTAETKRPDQAKAEELYVYRPDFYQDEDGIAHRIAVFMNPASRLSVNQRIAEALSGNGATNLPPIQALNGEAAMPESPTVKAVPATSAVAPVKPVTNTPPAPVTPNLTPAISSKGTRNGVGN